MRNFKKTPRLHGIVAVLGVALFGRATAQTITTLHSFMARSITSNSDGALPQCKLTLSGNVLYGTTSAGGSSDYGTVFELNTDSTGYKILHTFNGPIGTRAGGSVQGLVLLGNGLYGTAMINDTNFVFTVKSDGTGFNVLHTFTGGTDGRLPLADMIIENNTLYGTTAVGGGASDNGTVFRLGKDGTGFATLNAFAAIPSLPPFTNSSGAGPRSGLALSGKALFGTTYWGGTLGRGTIFSVGVDGTNFRTLYNFSGSADGGSPEGTLLLASDTLYGTTFSGGTGLGTVFAVNTNGTGFKSLHSFKPISASFPYGNSDGAYPSSGLILLGDTLYGTAVGGGTFGNGTVFAVNTDGTGFTNLYYFTGANGDGAAPRGALILSSNTLYGTTSLGGSFGGGTVFSLSFLPQLRMTSSASNVILTWPTNYAGFDYSGYTLQSTTNLLSPVWSTNLPSTVVVNGQHTLTNPISGTQQFFRLSQ